MRARPHERTTNAWANPKTELSDRRDSRSLAPSRRAIRSWHAVDYARCLSPDGSHPKHVRAHRARNRQRSRRQHQPSFRASKPIIVLGWLATGLMGTAAVRMFIPD
jgi:hypothetical protein